MKKLLIIDSNSVIHRAFHALPFLSTKQGEPTNAVYGFLLVFFRVIKDFQPDYIAAVFDFPAPNFRHKKFKQYKANRPPTPKDLSIQIPKIKDFLNVFNVYIFEKKGFEADDIIGAITEVSSVENIILTGDSDLFQLVQENIKVYFLKKGVKDTVLYNKELVKEKLQGLFPQQILDLKSLKGDASDNIPGVAGIGEKTALDLILKFGSLENIYCQIEKDSLVSREIKPKTKEILIKGKKNAFLSKELVKIKKDIEIKFELEKCFWKNYNKEKVIDLLAKFEFYSLINKLSSFQEIEINDKIKKNFGNKVDPSKKDENNRQKTLF